MNSVRKVRYIIWVLDNYRFLERRKLTVSGTCYRMRRGYKTEDHKTTSLEMSWIKRVEENKVRWVRNLENT